MQLPLLSLIIATAALAFVATILIPGRFERAIKIVNALAAALSVAIAGAIWFGYDQDLGGLQFSEQLPWIPSLGVDWFLAVDGFGVAMTMLNALVFLTGVLSMWSLKERVKEYFAFMGLLVVGVFGVFASQDVFLFFFFYEVAVLPMYPLIAVWGSTRKRYSAMKLTLFLMAGSALLFPGLLALKAAAGIDSWSIPALAAADIPHEAQLFLYPFLYIGFGILAGMFPFHGWSPTGHVAAPTAVSMLHAGVLMKLGAFGILRIAMTILPDGAQAWAFPFAILATVNIVYGAFVALRQTDFKYVIGFSSVSHMGIVLLGLNTLTVNGVNGAAFQMFAHGIMTALFFSAVGFIYEQTHDRDIRHFGGLVRQVPVASAFFIIAALCGMGVPGFASFWAELLVFIAALRTWPLIGALVIIGLIFTAAYVLRVLGKAMFGPANPKWDHLRDSGLLVSTPRIILVAVLLILGFFPRLLLDLIEPATQALLRTS